MLAFDHYAGFQASTRVHRNSGTPREHVWTLLEDDLATELSGDSDVD